MATITIEGDLHNFVSAEELEHYLLVAEDGSIVPASTCRLIDNRHLSEGDAAALDSGNDNVAWQVACERGTAVIGYHLL